MGLLAIPLRIQSECKLASSRTQSQDLGDESFVECSETLFACHGGNCRHSPVVLGNYSGHLDGVLDPTLDDIKTTAMSVISFS